MGNDFFDSSHDNRFARCVELELSEGQGTDPKSLTLLAEVRCGTGRLSSERFTASIGVTEVEITLKIDGGRVAPRTRYAEKLHPLEIRTESTLSHEDIRTNKSNISGRGNISLSPKQPSIGTDINLNAGLQRSSTRKITSTTDTSTTKQRVQAAGDGTWIVSEHENRMLDGTYLRDEALCRIESDHAIRRVVGIASVSKKDVRIISVTNNETGSAMRMSNNRKKILQILASETLGTDGDRIRLSESILVARDEK